MDGIEIPDSIRPDSIRCELEEKGGIAGIAKSLPSESLSLPIGILLCLHSRESSPALCLWGGAWYAGAFGSQIPSATLCVDCCCLQHQKSMMHASYDPPPLHGANPGCQTTGHLTPFCTQKQPP